MLKIAIVGSGLTAISAAKVLVKRGIKPTILDFGNELDSERLLCVKKMSSLEPSYWNKKDMKFIYNNSASHGSGSLPRKYAFGSDFFYGSSVISAPIECHGPPLPLSYAKGGFSAGWGSSVLPVDDNDIGSWPINNAHLEKYYKMILSDVPYSATTDDLSRVFPTYSNKVIAQNSIGPHTDILNDFKKLIPIKDASKLIYGKSRLLVKGYNPYKESGCKYCGYCMSGCVYGYIYKAANDLDNLIALNLVKYVPGVIVNSVDEVSKKVNISIIDKHKKQKKIEFDRVFIGAGAVNSTRIIMQSKKIYNKKIELLSTLSFVVPIFRFKKIPGIWPNVSTQPSVFMEYKVNTLSNHWIHVQLSPHNEFLYEKLGIDDDCKGVVQLIKRWIASHTIIALCNISSDSSDNYTLSLKKSLKDSPSMLVSRRKINIRAYYAVAISVLKFFYILLKSRYFVIFPFVKSSIKSGSYHVGGSLPMKKKVEHENDTDLLGRPKGWNYIHVIDSSVLPSIPATTIGLVSMANAARIADQVEL